MFPPPTSIDRFTVSPSTGQPGSSAAGRASAGRHPILRSARLLLPYAVVLLLTTSSALELRGEPWKRHTIDDSSRGADGVRLSDVNGDGRDDVVTGWEEGGRIRVYLHPGPSAVRRKWPAVTVGEIASPEDAVFADLDGDGAPDVVSCCEGTNRTVYIHWSPRERRDLLNPKGWRTEAIHCTRGKQSWMFALPMDVDGQAGVDIVVGSKGQEASIGWLRSPEDPRATDQWRFQPLYWAGWIMSLIATDMDGDGDMDVLASDRKGASRGILWLENPGPEAASDAVNWRVHRVGGDLGEVMFIARGAPDRAGGDEILAAVRGGNLLSMARRDGSAWFRTDIPMPRGCGTGKSVAIADVDLDGTDDVVFSCENAGDGRSGVRWMSRRADADWRDFEISGPAGTKFDLIQMVDLDADGDLDVLTCEERDGLGVIWYENPTR